MLASAGPVARELGAKSIASCAGLREERLRVQLTLEQRLLRFLAREERDELRSHRELRAQPIEVRVLEGECLEQATFLGPRGLAFVFAVADNASKFRPGDPLLVGDGVHLDAAIPLVLGDYDATAGELRLERDAFVREAAPRFEVGRQYVIDRRSLGLTGRLREVVQACFAVPRLRALLTGELPPGRDAARHQRAAARLRACGLNDTQADAGAAAIATDGVALVQGPPGTGKTRLLAEVIAMLCQAGCRIALCAFTHRAVDNALAAIRRLAPELSLFKLGTPSADSQRELRALGVQSVEPRRARLPERGCVVAGTCFQLAKLHESFQCHYTVFDEAGQMPIPHALPGLLRSQRWLLFGDHQQLPPVVTTADKDALAAMSVFELLHQHYGAALLDTTYRMNDGVCRLIGDTYYDGRLRPAPAAAQRRLPFAAGGRLDEVLAPGQPVVWLRIDHQQPGQRSPVEASAVADLVADLVQQHGVPAAEIAVIAPFRAQVRLLRSAIQQKQLRGSEDIVVDTVERIQGQEREAVIVSLTTGDPQAVRGRGAFHLSSHRLNVALSRARSKAVLVASAHAFTALPADPEGLRMAARGKALRDRLPCVDLTRVYVP